MDAKLFWQLIGDVCRLGEFIAGMHTNGAETNIVGRFRVMHDGIELVLERENCGDHFHIAPEKIRAIQFGYCENAIQVIEPCLQLINLDSQVSLILILYPYEETELKPKYKRLMEKHQAYSGYLTGEW